MFCAILSEVQEESGAEPLGLLAEAFGHYQFTRNLSRPELADRL